jgi:crotonobetainyl-CoA:carnitine CoA-transferase CaiB-like acyl-CoA transferase
MLKHSTEEWLEILGPLGVPCGPINSVDQVFEHPQAIHREMKLEMDHPVTGKIPMVANPIHFKEHPITYQSPPPLLGEHNQDVLENILGLSKSEIESLQRQGTI